jgi:hypothetical protein
MKKRLIIIVFSILILSLLLCGCNNKSISDDDKSVIDDKNNNDSLYGSDEEKLLGSWMVEEADGRVFNFIFDKNNSGKLILYENISDFLYLLNDSNLILHFPEINDSWLFKYEFLNDNELEIRDPNRDVIEVLKRLI